MAKIKNIDGLSMEELELEIRNGARFVLFQYCFSILIMTFKRGSDIYFIRSGDSTGRYSRGFTLTSLFFGWWGIPWGPIYTISSVYSNVNGGKNVTEEVMASLRLDNA
jgi:hypothetical protein